MKRAYWGLLLVCAAAAGETANEKVGRLLRGAPASLVRSEVGVTRQMTLIPALATQDDLNYETKKTRVLLVGGLDSSPASVDAALAALSWFYTAPDARKLHSRFAISAIPVANPDGWAAGSGPANGSGGNPARGYPPAGDAYSSPSDPEAAYLWRWIGMHAPDLVVEVRAGEPAGWHVPDSLARLAKALKRAHKLADSGELAPQLNRGAPSGTGAVPAIQLRLGARPDPEALKPLLAALDRAGFRSPSPARQEIQRRLARSPLDVARQLAVHYGHELPEVVYIPAVALIGRLRLGELTGDQTHLEDVERIVGPYYRGEKSTLGAKPTSSHLSGHLVFGELARLTGKPRYIELARAAADLGFDEGRPKESMPLHNEMSDSVFMGCPILVQTARLTGDAKFYEMALRHLRFMRKLCLRPDGLYRHSPLDEAAWGRGNGFPALGLALSLSYLPEDRPERSEMIEVFRAHMEALNKGRQDPAGAWRQVIDFPGSYRELTATCMIGFAMLRGVRSGWLERRIYEPAIERAWYAVRTRVAADGNLVDVCTSTGKQKSLRDYLDRTAILGRDPRGGAMALLFATEMAQWEKERGLKASR